MYAPDALNSFASVGSTSVILPVTFLALSLGTKAPHWLQCTAPELPLPPFDLPLLALFFGIYCVRIVWYPLNLVFKIPCTVILPITVDKFAKSSYHAWQKYHAV
jgi:hypothetical protein